MLAESRVRIPIFRMQMGIESAWERDISSYSSCSKGFILVTVSILIGNTDNKLSQQEWSGFVASLRTAVGALNAKEHFFGAPPNYAPQQNACWVIEIDDQQIEELKRLIAGVRSSFKQDSAAMLIGKTELV